ncbi:hypothetical protein PIB30_067294 [Stylosanthes scabra]|uniref:Uncharacterized protein n=1 Tax=Stylosanthes scabra TaxID=79078 RepID=A0ABU6SML4_9FABA|nr:hypothetical protein [Stylosanthes scabra]
MARRKSCVSIKLGVQIVYDRGRMIGPRGSTTDGDLVLVSDRSGLAMITDRVSSS